MSKIKSSLNKIEEKFKQKISGSEMHKLTELKRTAFPELEAKQKEAREKISVESQKSAIDTAARLQPHEKGSSDHQYLAPIASKFKEIESLIHKTLQTKGLGRYKKQVIDFKDQELNESKPKKAKLENEIANEERSIRGKYGEKPEEAKVSLIGVILVIVLVGGEIVFNSLAFQGLGFSMIKALIVAATVVISLAFLGFNVIEEFGKEIAKRSYPKIWLLGSLIFLCFFAIAYMRVYYINQMGDGQSMSTGLGTIVFVVINAIIFGGTSYVFHKFFPKKHERQRYKTYLDALNVLNALKDELKAIEEEEAQLRSWATNNSQKADDIIDYANELLKSNLASYRTVATEWRREVALRLPHSPECFKNDIPELTCELVVRDDDSLLGTKSINA